MAGRALVTGLAVGATLLWPAAAGAHQPVFVDDATPAASSPVIEDGRVLIATYGVITEPGATSAIRLRLGNEDSIPVHFWVPDRAPENQRAVFDDLTLTITRPDGSVETIVGGTPIGPAEDPDTDTHYLEIAVTDQLTGAGLYELAVTSSTPTRFALSTGSRPTEAIVTGATERGPGAVTAWYTTPPPALATAGAPPTTEVRHTVAPRPEVQRTDLALADDAGPDDPFPWGLTIAATAAVAGIHIVVLRRRPTAADEGETAEDPPTLVEVGDPRPTASRAVPS